MSGLERIVSFADIPALKKEQAEVLSALKEIDTQINNMSKFRLTSTQGGIGDMRKQTDSMQKEIDRMTLMQEKLSTAVAKRAAAVDKAAADQLIAEQKVQQAILKTEEAENRRSKSQTQSSAQMEAARRKEQKITEDVMNDYKQLSLAYNDAALAAKNHALRLGETHPVTIQAIKDANDMGDKLKKLDATVGQHQRNVGNYASGWMSFNNVIRETPNFAISATTGIQALSNNIPMFADEIKKARDGGKSWGGILKELGANLFSFGGVATLATIALTALPKIVAAMSENTGKATKTFKSFTEVQQEATKNTIKEKTELEALLFVARDENKTKAERSAAVKKINDIMPDYLGDIKLEEINTQKTTEKVLSYINTLSKKALAQAYISKIQELYSKQIDIENSSLADNIKWYQYLWLAMKNGTNTATLNNDVLTTGINNRQKSIATIKTERDALEKKFNADLKSGKAQMDLDKEVKDEKAKNAQDLTGEIISSEQARLKALMDMQKLSLESNSKYLKETADDEKNSILLRTAAYQAFAFEQKQLAEISKEEEVARLNEKLKAIEGIEKISVAKQSNEQKKLLIEKDALLAEKSLAEQKYAQQILDININLDKALQDMAAKQREKAVKDAKDKMQTKEGKGIVANMGLDLKELEDFNKTKFDTNEAYEEALTDMQEKQRKRRQTLELSYLYDELQFAVDYGLATVDIEKKIADIKIKIEEDRSKKTGDILKKDADKKKKAAEDEKKTMENLWKDLAEKSFELGKTLLSGKFTDEQNRLQEQIDKNNELKSVETERINKSTLSEQQKADQIAILNAKTAAQNEQLQKKQRESKLKEAKFDRDAQALKILGETLFQAAKAGWITPAAILIEAAGAVSIATLYAKKLPTFAKGTNASPEGLAITDEKGPEMYIEPSGKVFMGSDKGPTLRYLKRNTKIITAEETRRLMSQSSIDKAGKMFDGVDQNMAAKLDRVGDLLLWQTSELKKVYNQKKGTTVNNKIDLGWYSHIKKNVFD